MGDVSCSRQPRDGGAPSNDKGDDGSLIRGVRDWMRSLLRQKNGETVRETLEELFEERDDGEIPINDHERTLLGNILQLRDVSAYDVMVPRADIDAVDVKTGLPELVALFTEKGHSRLPVYRGTLDDAVGMVHIKDVLAHLAASGDAAKPFQLIRIMRKLLFVSPSIRVPDLLVEMRLKRTHMALVVDEYGGIDGLVTIEDLVEQIVGDIEDEHDTDTDPDFVERADGIIEADARIPLETFEERFGALLSDDEREDIDTLGGLVFFLAGRVPTRGELIRHDSGIEFEVVDADPRRIKRLRVHPAVAEMPEPNA